MSITFTPVRSGRSLAMVNEAILTAKRTGWPVLIACAADRREAIVELIADRAKWERVPEGIRLT